MLHLKILNNLLESASCKNLQFFIERNKTNSCFIFYEWQTKYTINCVCPSWEEEIDMLIKSTR